MAQQNPTPQQTASSSAKLPHSAQVRDSLNEVTTTAELLRTEVDRIGFLPRLFGFGRRVLVPADEIHVVVGDGLHSLRPTQVSRVFGKTADRSSYYWLNPLTQVIKLKTVSFTVPVVGLDGGGVEALDSSKVSFLLWAHAVAKLNPDKADIAAQRVGLDTSSLISTITKVGTAELVAAAATMPLEEIIANRQRLAEIAFPKVNQILSELGYDLALLTVTALGGEAYRRLVEQAEARISKETSIATNREQIAEIQDLRARERTEAEITAETDKKLAGERLEAERIVAEATMEQQEALAIRRHELDLRQIERDKAAANVKNESDLVQVELKQKIARTDTENEAQLARLRAEREAELRVLEQQRGAALRLAEAQAEAERLAVMQVREIERVAERTRAEAERLREEELAAAERAKAIALVHANQLGEALKVEAEAEARALQLKVDAETKADLVKAEAEATATEKRAQAAKVRAEATRAEAAAIGLAEAEVEAAQVKVAEQRVVVTRAEGLAQAEIVEAQATAEASRVRQLREVEINAQQAMIQLYQQAPVLVELERMKLQMAHEERLTQLRLEANLRAFEALAPSLRVHIYGNGGQTSRIIGDVMALAQGLRVLGEEVPAVGRLVEGVVTQNSNDGDLNILSKLNLPAFAPYLQQVVDEVNPRMLGSLTVSALVEHLAGVVNGQKDLSQALNDLRQDGSFRVIGDLPVLPILRLIGLVAHDEPAANGNPETIAVSG